jgi:hypothetical protein
MPRLWRYRTPPFLLTPRVPRLVLATRQHSLSHPHPWTFDLLFPHLDTLPHNFQLVIYFAFDTLGTGSYVYKASIRGSISVSISPSYSLLHEHLNLLGFGPISDTRFVVSRTSSPSKIDLYSPSR